MQALTRAARPVLRTTLPIRYCPLLNAIRPQTNRQSVLQNIHHNDHTHQTIALCPPPPDIPPPLPPYAAALDNQRRRRRRPCGRCLRAPCVCCRADALRPEKHNDRPHATGAEAPPRVPVPHALEDRAQDPPETQDQGPQARGVVKPTVLRWH